MVRLPTDADETSGTGVSRTVTVELLLMLSSVALGFRRGSDPPE
jgi:hypothetical protein